MNPIEKWKSFSRTVKATVFLWLVIDATVIWQIVVNDNDRAKIHSKFCFKYLHCISQAEKFKWEIFVFVVVNLLMYTAYRMIHEQTKKEDETSEEETSTPE
jgi:hypothetical protein